MPLQQRLKRLKQRITDRLDGFSPNRSSPSLPNVAALNNTLAPPVGHPIDLHSESNLLSTNYNNGTSATNQSLINLAAPQSPQTTGGVTLLSSHTIGSSSGQAQGQSTPLQTSPVASSSAATPSAVTDSWVGPKALLKVLEQSTSVFGPLKAVVDEFINCIETYERAAGGRREFRALQGELEGLFQDLQGHFSHNGSPAITTSVESLCRSLQQELEYVKEKQRESTKGRYFETREGSDDILACYRRIQSHLQRLSLNANLEMWRIADEQATDARLDRLCSSLSACYDSAQAAGLKRGACTPGTRTDVLAQMHGWVHNRSAGSVYWLNGMAGTGKTTIAYSLSAQLETTHKLGASFFCSRALPDCRDVNLIIPSIAYQLAVFSRPFRFALSRVLEKERNAHARQLRTQFENLIVKPLGTVRDTLPEDLVVVIDALDECDDQQSTGRILDTIFTKTSGLPIKFFVSSRPEPEIRDQMQKQGGHKKNARLVLHELDKGTVQADIEAYIREALAPIRPAESQIATLVERAGILFIYAATVARYIGYDSFRRNPRARLETILSASAPSGSNPYKDIDELYTVILKAAIDDPELSDMEREDIRQVLYTAVCAREPLTLSTLSGLLGLNDIERARAALRPLWSVLHVVEMSEHVTTLHASFPDYMFDPKRSKEYHCDSGAHEHTLTRCCFDCIKCARPQFNICGLESSYVPDEKIPDLKERIEQTISSELYYACQYWASHLEKINSSPELLEQLEDFLSVRLLLWMEVMNVNKRMHDGVDMMRLAQGWCKRQQCSQELLQLMHDGWRFVVAFTSSPVSQSTPHLYVSMLPIWPESTPIAKRYLKHLRAPTVAQGPAISRRRLELLATWSADGTVSGLVWLPNGTQIVSVAGGEIFVLDALTGRTVVGPLKQKSGRIESVGCSHDGTRLVSGSRDGTIRVWDTQSGKKMLGPLRGHTSMITSVAFSRDGTRIVSGSRDNTIGLWDGRNGKKLVGPLKGHSSWVTSVAFSSDGARIVSGSDDKTIHVWDTQSGQTMLGPLQGHTECVTSVAFSPDSAYIISGSDDATIRMWDIQGEKTMPGPLQGHTNSIASVAFSPDGTRIVSGSGDTTICVWDTQSGQTVLGPLQGHTAVVMSVVFSPDGTRIVSGSPDKTICVWDVQGGQTVLGSLPGHISSVTSVAFSSDGTRIVSGSNDKAIRMWDNQSGEMVLGPLQGHTNLVTSVAFSPDGTRIVSSSNDKTIRVWDTQSGGTVLGPLQGHARSVGSVAFSPDGIRIASGSDDQTIRVWDTRSGQTMLGPLQGHTGWVTSVAFSPDGTCVVSGSSDKTIRMWDTQSGETVLGPLQGHTDGITSVAFSPDGTRIVSGSNDKTIRVWDNQTGEMVLGPLQHTDLVRSVAFSPNGTCIVSGSNDKTICVWGTQSGQTVLGPLRGHIDWVLSVAFSPDGTRIVSGSSDRTIRVWDIQSAPKMVQLSTSMLHDPTSWDINADGWVVDQSRLLAWVSSDLHHIFQRPRNTLLISTEGYVRLNLTDAQIGESWIKCYQP